MASITTRAGKGSPLTNNEVDANFTNLNDDKQEILAEGAFVDGDKNKLDGIEAGATADQTAAEIKTAYESNADTNAFTDAEQSKLSGIEANADVTDTANVTAAGALMDSEVANLAQVKAFDSADYATAAQGDLADTALQDGDTVSSLAITSADINGGTIDGVTIGGASAGAVTATTITGSGDMNIDSGTLFVDASENRVGIGTTSPSRTFVVSGGLDPIIGIVSTGTGTSQLVFGDSADDNAGRIYYDHDTNSMRFYTNTAERMRIDSSGNLLVGKTTLTNSTAGVELNSTGQLVATFASGTHIFGRNTSDGSILEFRKDNTTVGAITARSNSMSIGRGGTGLHFYDSGDAIFPESITGGASRDNAIDLGISTVRWKDLYLSGGAYIGGTGAANYLDDYEEGTWTPSPITSGYTIASQNASYVKIGKLVCVKFQVNFSAVGVSTSSVQLSGLPFSTVSGSSTGAVRDNSTTGAIYMLHTKSSLANLEFNSMDNVVAGAQRTIRTGENYIGTVTYETDS